MADAHVVGPKPTKACVNCRRQKMKCQVDDVPPCRRCRIVKAECIFRPRANAAAVPRAPDCRSNAIPPTVYSFSSSPANTQSVLARLDKIETILGIKKGPDAVASLEPEEELDTEPEGEDFSFHGVWRALSRLKAITRPPQDAKIWSRSMVKQLWRSFHSNLPLLHFLADRKAFSSPTPLLLASILYISALHHNTAETASVAPGYFAATCSAIAELVMPPPPVAPAGSPGEQSNSAQSSSQVEDQVFHNILGLIMASLSSEAFIETTGTWISIGYRLLLDHCPHQVQDTRHDWRGLFSGLQIIDVEHASIHMCYPLLPKQPPPLPLQKLDRHQDNAYRGLAQMMHSGLSHFVGRGLPSVWSFVSGKDSNGPPSAASPFTEHDFQVIRHWAKQLDEWLVRYNGASQPSEADRHGILILLQYHLHKLFVLSIYHPARGYDLGAHNITSAERQELLISARAVLRLRDNDTGIWSNWDLVMVTLAALLVLRGVEDGMAHQEDLNLVQSHLSSLQRCQRPAPSLQHVLADRLERALQGMRTPPAGPELMIDTNIEYSWAIFDQNNMPLANPSWLLQDQMHATPKPSVPIAQASETRDGMSEPYHSGLVGGEQALHARQWIGQEQSNAWPSTLYRLFGHDDSMQENSA